MWRFSRSSGPGGQHVNTSDSQVELRFDLAATEALPPVWKERALERLARAAGRRRDRRTRLRAPLAVAQPRDGRGPAGLPARRGDRAAARSRAARRRSRAASTSAGCARRSSAARPSAAAPGTGTGLTARPAASAAPVPPGRARPDPGAGGARQPSSRYRPRKYVSGRPSALGVGRGQHPADHQRVVARQDPLLGAALQRRQRAADQRRAGDRAAVVGDVLEEQPVADPALHARTGRRCAAGSRRARRPPTAAARASRSSIRESLRTLTSTSGGSSETDMKAVAVMPTSSPRPARPRGRAR